MRKIILAVLFLSALMLVYVHPPTARAQTPGVPIIQSVVTATSCTVTASTTTLCLSNDAVGLSISKAGGAFAQVATIPVSSSVTINGKTGTTFTISSTATAPSVAVNVQ